MAQSSTSPLVPQMALPSVQGLLQLVVPEVPLLPEAPVELGEPVVPLLAVEVGEPVLDPVLAVEAGQTQLPSEPQTRLPQSVWGLPPPPTTQGRKVSQTPVSELQNWEAQSVFWPHAAHSGAPTEPLDPVLERPVVDATPLELELVPVPLEAFDAAEAEAAVPDAEVFARPVVAPTEPAVEPEPDDATEIGPKPVELDETVVGALLPEQPVAATNSARTATFMTRWLMYGPSRRRSGCRRAAL